MPKKTRKTQTASLKHEHEYLEKGYMCIIGLDEVGRGPWAGPVAAGAVCLPIQQPDLSQKLAGVRDSKQMTPRQRTKLADTIKATALGWGIGSASSAKIDELGIVPAVRLAMKRALEMLLTTSPDHQPDCLFLDALLWPEMGHIPQVSLVGGDARSLSIAAASVIAKVWRDSFMVELDAQYPGYGFAAHKGYGTPQHQAALKQHGVTPIHRQSFKPIRALLEQS